MALGFREKWGEEVSGERSHSPKEEGVRAEWGHPRMEGGGREMGNGAGLAKEQVCPMGETHTEAI